MSLPLEDFRGKVTAETHVWLDAKAQLEGREKSEIVREILHEVAMREIHAARVLAGLYETKGLAGQPREEKK